MASQKNVVHPNSGDNLHNQNLGSSTKKVINTIDLENWMSKLPYHLAAQPIIYLSIPGSHNSFSYSISRASGVSPDSPPIVQCLGRWFRPITNFIVYNWSLGQGEDVMAQLKYGIRYFDIRLVLFSGDICIAHGLYGGKIQAFLEQINEFLNNHPQEIVILDFQHFYQFNLENHERMLSMLQEVFDYKICHRQHSMKLITVDGLWRNKNQIIIVYRCSMIASGVTWPTHAWITPWPNKQQTDALLQYLDNGLVKRREDVGYVSQGILTPDIKYVIFHITSTLKKLALRNNKKLSAWLETKSNGKHGINVVICDFVETNKFCEKVIRLNYKDTDNSVNKSPTKNLPDIKV